MKLFNKFFLIGVALVLAGSALAQDKENSKWGLRLGGFYPGEGAVRDATKNLWPAVGIDWFLPIGEGNTSNFLLSVDWFKTSSGRDFTIIPFTFGIRFLQDESEKTGGNFYGSVGAGWYFIDSSAGGNNDKFGGYAGFGFEGRSGFSVDLRYHWFDKLVENLDGRGLTGSLGWRF